MLRMLAITALTACGGAHVWGEPVVSHPWPTRAGFRAETIPFPLEFAPSLQHQGAEELRFAPGFFDPAAPGYWSYAFVWRVEDPAALTSDVLAAELTTYFRGLVHAVDPALDAQAVSVTATPAGARLTLTVHMIDAFKTKQPIDLVGWAERRPCNPGALWLFVITPPASMLRPQLEDLAAKADCTNVHRH